MAFNTFVKIVKIDGESTDSKHQGWIELISYYGSMTQTISRTASSSGGASADRVDFNIFGFTKLLDKASPLLALACADGTHINTIILELCRAGTEKMPFMRYTMTNCLIISVDTFGTRGEQFPSEDLEICFGKIEWSYSLQSRSTGGPIGNIATAWNLEKNTSA